MKTIQSIFNSFGRLFVKLRYYKKADPFKLFYSLSKDKTIDYKSKGSLLIAPIRVTPTSNLFEGLIGYFFKIRGYEVKALVCDQSISFCENKSKNNRTKKITCSLCLAEQKRFCKYFGFEKISIKDYISAKEVNGIKKVISKLNFDTDEDFIHNSIDYKDDIYSGTLRYTLKSEVKTDSDFAILKKAAFTSFTLSTAFKNITNQNSFDHLIISHGIYSTWGSILSSAKKYKLNTIVWGRGYIGQGDLMFGHNCSTHDESIIEDKQAWCNLELSKNEKENVMKFFETKFSGVSKLEHVNYYDKININSSNNRLFFNKLESYNRVFGMFTNIPWDGQVFNKTEGFPTTQFYITNTIDWFLKNKDCALVIRSHPAEKTRKAAKGTETFQMLLKELYPVLPENVYFIEPENSITSYDLAKNIDAAIMYGSTLSLEFSVMGIPVIQTGKYNVNGKKIVYEVTNKNDFWKLLDKIKNEKIEYTSEMKRNAINYAHYWISKRHIKDTSVNLENLRFKSFNFNSINEFEKNETMNFIYGKIVNNQKIIQQ